MISGVNSSIPNDHVIRVELAAQASLPVPDQHTVLPAANTVQQNDSLNPTNPAKSDASSPLIVLSPELVTALQGQQDDVAEATDTTEITKDATAESSREGTEKSAAGLTESEEAQVDALKERDQEVRTHEQAHAIAGGQYSGSPSYEYETGPDGQQYAVGGEVQIDTAAIPGDPSATIAKMETVIKAALAPAEPSGPDKAVAAAATQKKLEALAELNAQKQAERSGEIPESEVPVSENAPSGSTPTSGFVNPVSDGGSDTIINLFA